MEWRTHHELVNQAAIVIEDASAGRRALDCALTERERWYHSLYYRNSFVKNARRIVMLAFLAISFFEAPPWFLRLVGKGGSIHNGRAHQLWGPHGRYQTSEIPYVPLAASGGVELFALLCFASELELKRRIRKGHFFKSRANGARVSLVVADGVGLLLAAATSRPDVFYCRGVFRMLFLMLRFRKMRHIFVNVMSTLPDIAGLLGLVGVLVLFFGWFGFVVFSGTLEGQADFESIPASVWSMLILITTANFPDVMMPAYGKNRWSGLFFAAFLVIGLFLLLNIVLAVVYNHYKDRVEAQYEATVARRKDGFDLAFRLLDVERDGSIPKDRFEKLCTILRPDLQGAGILGRLIDRDGDGNVDREEFSDVFGAMRIRIDQPVKSLPMYRKLKNRYPETFASLAKFVSHPYFDFGVNAVLLTNAICVAIESVDAKDGKVFEEEHWIIIEAVANALFLLEMLTKVIALGPVLYLSTYWNRFDGLVTILAVIAEILVQAGLLDSKIARFALVLRLLRLLKLLTRSRRITRLFQALFSLAPVCKNFATMQLMVFFFFATIGVQAFGGCIYIGNHRLSPPYTQDGGYLPNNMNDFPNALMTLFELLVVNNWFVIVQGFEEGTGSKWVRLYFVAFWVFGVLILTNLLIAFILEAFVSEWAIQKEEAERRRACVEAKCMHVDGEHGGESGGMNNNDQGHASSVAQCAGNDPSSVDGSIPVAGPLENLQYRAQTDKGVRASLGGGRLRVDRGESFYYERMFHRTSSTPTAAGASEAFVRTTSDSAAKATADAPAPDPALADTVPGASSKGARVSTDVRPRSPEATDDALNLRL